MVPCHGRGGNLVNDNIYSPPKETLKPNPCGLFVFHTFITWEGDVLTCCHDLTGETKLGNIITDGIDKIVTAKQKFTNNSKFITLCNKCDEPLRFCNVPTGEPPKDRRERRKFFKSVVRDM